MNFYLETEDLGLSKVQFFKTCSLLPILSCFWYKPEIEVRHFHLVSGASFISFDCISPSISVIVQGGSTISPWGMNSFSDPTALWIWSTYEAYINAPVGVTVRISKAFYIEWCHPCMTGSVALGSAFVSADNHATIYLNGAVLGTVNNGWTSMGVRLSLNISAGYNTLLFDAINDGGPAGLIFAIYCDAGDSSILLMHSDGSWAVGSTVYENETNIVSRCPSGVQLHIILTTVASSALIVISMIPAPSAGASACTLCPAGSYYNYSGVCVCVCVCV